MPPEGRGLDVRLQEPAARVVDEHGQHVVRLQEGLGHGRGGAQAHLVLARATAEEERDREPLRHGEESSRPALGGYTPLAMRSAGGLG